MAQLPLSEKIIFGLKVRQLRKQKALSFADLSATSGMSISYLNEIEKGKKYPSKARLEKLASALGVTIGSLEGEVNDRNFEPIVQLLRSNFLNELPLDVFGIDLSKIAELISDAPTKVSAFISTILEIANNYAVKEEHFYLSALRSYQELHANYFADIEEMATEFLKENNLTGKKTLSIENLETLLSSQFKTKIDVLDVQNNHNLESIRSLYQRKTQTFFLNPELRPYQRAFQLAKELGYQFMKLNPRSYTSNIVRINNFEEVLNNYKAGYFAVSVLIQKDVFAKDLDHFFGQTTWQPSIIFDMLSAYQASPEMLFQRFNLLPAIYGIKDVFFQRFIHSIGSDTYTLDKELQLHNAHIQDSHHLKEHFCRRWISLEMLKRLNTLQKEQNYGQLLLGVQKAHFLNSGSSYFCLTLARPGHPSPDSNVSVTIGAKIDASLKRVFRFLDDPEIPEIVVNTTCERCNIEHCAVRVAEPTALLKKKKYGHLMDTLDRLINEG